MGNPPRQAGYFFIRRHRTLPTNLMLFPCQISILLGLGYVRHGHPVGHWVNISGIVNKIFPVISKCRCYNAIRNFHDELWILTILLAIEGAWKTAKSAASEYFDVLDARQGLEKKYVSASGGNMAVGDTNVYKDKYGLDWDTHKTVQEKANQMRSNSNAWHAANSAGNTYLADTYVSKNENLVKEIESLIGKKLYRDGDGVWHIDDGQGTQLYKVYHKGGIVGSNEEFAKVEKGELVVPKDQVKPTMMMLEWGNSLASKWKSLFSSGGLMAGAMSDAIKGAPLSAGAGAIVNNNAPSFAPNIQVEVKYDSSASPEDAKRFGKNITSGIVEAFHRKGVGAGATPLLTGI